MHPTEKLVIRTDRHQRQLSFPLDAAFPFHASTWRLSSFARGLFDCHWHSDIEFERVLEGEMTFQANGTRFTLRKGEGVYLAGNALHSAWLEGSEDCVYQVVRIEPALLGGLEGTRLFEDCIQPLLLDPRLAFLHLTPDVPWQADLLDRIGGMQQLADEAASGYELEVMQRMYGVWHALYRHAESLPAPAPRLRGRTKDGALPARDVERMRRALLHVAAHYAERITLAEIAASMALSEGECCRLFRKMLRTSPMEYVIAHRIRQSLPLVAAGAMSVTEIAQRTGFSSSSYFTETFHRIVALTPTEYRNREGVV